MNSAKIDDGLKKNELSDKQLLRYSRQIFLPDVDIEGQLKLSQANIVIVGVGGLGSITATLLAAAGVGKITLVDFDRVDFSNLPRQIFYQEADVGRLKVDCLATYIQQQNNEIQLEKVAIKLSQIEFQTLFEGVDLVLDGTDNFATRYLINRACLMTKTPLLSAAITQFSGQVIMFDYKTQAPCYACLYADEGVDENNCSENGVMGPAASMVASLQAIEAQKCLIGMPVASRNTLISLDMKSIALHKAFLSRDDNCDVCANVDR